MFEAALSKNARNSLAILGKSHLFKDIAAMKIAAISDRGTKRDFVDLYFLIKDKIVSLDQCLVLYDKKYRALEQNKLHIIKSLTYFKDADADGMPSMLRDAKWREVKRFFEGQIKTFVRSKT